MSCFHPLKGFVLGHDPETGKKIMKICGPFTAFVQMLPDGRYQSVDAPGNVSQQYERDLIRLSRSSKIFREWIPIPCGKCIGCRMDYSRKWADRLMLEFQNSSNACFITLTYDNDHLPTNALGIPTLRKDDVQKFIKRLRKHEFGSSQGNLRYYFCGEYGSDTGRPHYHAILFNYFPSDAKIFKSDTHGFNYYISNELRDIWPFGFHLIAEVNWNTCAYVSRYVLKKANGVLKEKYINYDICPEFSLMSRRPGIAREFLTSDVVEKMLFDEKGVYISTSDGGKLIPFPQYYWNLLELDPIYEDVVRDHKEESLKKYLDNIEQKLKGTDCSYYEMLAHEEIAFKNSAKNKYKLKGRNVNAVKI